MISDITLSFEMLLTGGTTLLTVGGALAVMRLSSRSMKRNIEGAREMATRAHRRIDFEERRRIRREAIETTTRKETFRRLDSIEGKVDHLIEHGCALGCAFTSAKGERVR